MAKISQRLKYMVASFACLPVEEHKGYGIGTQSAFFHKRKPFFETFFDHYSIREQPLFAPEASLDEIINSIELSCNLHDPLPDKVFCDEVFLRFGWGIVDCEAVYGTLEVNPYGVYDTRWYFEEKTVNSFSYLIPEFSGYVKLSDIHSTISNHMNPHIKKVINFVTSNYKFETYPCVFKHFYNGNSVVLEYPTDTILSKLCYRILLDIYITYSTL